MSNSLSTSWYFRLAGFILLSWTAWSQSKYADAFGRYRQTGDRDALIRETNGYSQSTDLRIEVPVLLETISSNSDPWAKEWARLHLFVIASLHPEAYANPIEREIFLPAVAIVESHLDEAQRDEKSQWARDIVCLTAFLGFPPSDQALALIYRMVDNKDQGAQYLALTALARLRPVPDKAKQILFSRIAPIPDKLSGVSMIRILFKAREDQDVLQRFVKTLADFAQSQNPNDQGPAIEALSQLGPLAEPALEVLRRVQQRSGLNEENKARVQEAIHRIENKAPTENKDR